MLRHNNKNYLSPPMRDILLEHVDGRLIPIIRPWSIKDKVEAERASHLMKSQTALLARGLIRSHGRGKPTHTVITESGRVALRSVLAEYAELAHPGRVQDRAASL